MHQGGNTKYEGVSKMSEKSMLEAVKNVKEKRPFCFYFLELEMPRSQYVYFKSCYLIFTRFVWLFAILLAFAWMIWNIHGRVTYFLSRPSAISTERRFSDKLVFPKVTICNQNPFRYVKYFILLVVFTDIRALDGLLPLGLLFPISSKGSFICILPQT